MQEIDIDFDDTSYIPGVEFCFWGTLRWLDPFQPQLTEEERSAIVYGDCGALMTSVAARIDEYWSVD